MSILSQNTIQILRKAGWSENRSVDVGKYRQYFDVTGQYYSETVLEFLEEFGDLHVSYPNPHNVQITSGFYIDPIEATPNYPQQDIKLFSDQLKIPLCIVGGTRDADALLMSLDGKVYSAFDNYRCFVGGTGIDAIEVMCSGGKFTRIYFVKTVPR